MPRYQATADIPFPVARVFDILCRPARRVSLAPPDLSLQLIEGPEVVKVGSRVTVQGRRMGMSQRVVTEVVTLEPNALLVEEMQDSPFAFWRHTQRFTAISETATRLEDDVEYELPGGLLGLFLTRQFVEGELQTTLTHRNKRLEEELAE